MAIGQTQGVYGKHVEPPPMASSSNENTEDTLADLLDTGISLHSDEDQPAAAGHTVPVSMGPAKFVS